MKKNKKNEKKSYAELPGSEWATRGILRKKIKVFFSFSLPRFIRPSRLPHSATKNKKKKTLCRNAREN